MKIGLEKVRILTKLKTIQPRQEQEQKKLTKMDKNVDTNPPC